MPFTTKRRRIYAKTEAVVGTAETLALSDNVPRIRNARFRPISLQVERNIVRTTFTPLPKLVPGQTMIELTFEAEMGGAITNPKAVFDEPNWSKLISACGLKHANGKGLTIPASGAGSVVGGPFRHGETVTQATSAATGTVVGDTYLGQTSLFVRAITGTFNTTNVITGGTSAATCTPSGVTTNSLNSWRLNSDINTFDALTMALQIDENPGKYLRLKGCRGTVNFQFTHGTPIIMEFTFQGVLVSYTETAPTGTLQDSQLVPPTFFNTAFTLTDGTLVLDTATANKPTLSQMTLTLANAVSLRENSAGAPQGIDFAVVTSRSPTGSFNPDEVNASVYDFAASFAQGTVNRMICIVGSSSGSRFEFRVPGIVYAGLTDSDREEVYIIDASFEMTSGNYTLGGAGADNELVLLGT